MVVDLDNIETVKALVDHFMEQCISITVQRSIQMMSDVDCWRVIIVPKVPFTASDAYWNGFKTAIEESVVKFTPPSPENL